MIPMFGLQTNYITRQRHPKLYEHADLKNNRFEAVCYRLMDYEDYVMYVAAIGMWLPLIYLSLVSEYTTNAYLVALKMYVICSLMPFMWYVVSDDILCYCYLKSKQMRGKNSCIKVKHH